MSCGKHEVVTTFFYPCDDAACVWVSIGVVTGTFTLGETVNSSGTGAGKFRGALDNDGIILEETSGTFVNTHVLTGADSGATVTIGSAGTFDAVYDKSGTRGHAATTASHNGLVYEVTAGDAIFLPTGAAYPQPGASSFMICSVSSLISAAALREILVIGQASPATPRQIFIMNDHAKHRDDDQAGATTTTPTGTDLIGAGVEVSAAIVDRDLDKLLHYQGGVKIGEVALSGFGDYDFEFGMDLAANAVNHYQGMAMITFPDGVPGNVGAWMTEFESNMTGASVKGDRVLPTRWNYS